jgi:hypothetical protein
VKPADSARLDRLEGAVRTLAAGLAGLAGSLERELGAVTAERVADAAPPSPRLEKLIAGRIAVPIREVASWAGRSVRFVYAEIGRGTTLQMFGSGKVTADSVVTWCEKAGATP